ncbi:MAG: serine hydrolase domain-containing protein [Gemmatimonadota bacterium]|nr:serine hydrolase domain-containing protein [Gemmatimonadota bacterium]
MRTTLSPIPAGPRATAVRAAVLAVAMTLAVTPAGAQRGARGGAMNGAGMSLGAQADRIFAQFNSTHTPGCAVGAAQNGTTVLARGYGMADLETGTPITPNTIFESGSVAKQFTATGILLLVQDGKINLDDPVRKYIPELPEYPRPLLVRHLLSHTSGLREWSNLVALAGWPRGSRVHTQADLLEVVFAQKSLNYPVGDYYSYTNSGFALLPTIIERVSGMPFDRFEEERIFRPLGLANTGWRSDFTTIVPGRAQAYARRGGASAGWELDMPFENVIGPGGLLTTVGDWLKWNTALTGRTLGAAVVDSLTTRAVLTSGRTISYARGVIVGTYRGTAEIQHSGSTGGYSTFLARYPEKGVSIAVLCNAAGAPATQFTRQLADALIPGLAAASPPDTVAADSAAAARLAGVYLNARTHELLAVGGANGGGGAGASVRALRGGGWMLGNNRVLVDEANGAVTGLRVLGADADTVPYRLVARVPWQPTAQQLAAFAGRYRSDELPGTVWTVRVDGDQLVASPRPALDVTLTPAFTDGFRAGAGLGTIWFTRDARGAVMQMHSGAARVWDFVFTKAP